MDPLCSLEELELLDASHLTQLRTAGVWPRRLKKLLLEGAAVEELLGWPASLEQLDISECRALRVCAALPCGLSELAAARVPLVCDAWLAQALADCAAQLAWLDVSGTAAAAAPWRHARLQALLMEGCQAAAGPTASLPQVRREKEEEEVFTLVLGQLSVLSLRGASAAAWRGLASGAQLPALSSLCLADTAVSDAELAALLAALPLLRLDVSFCPALSDALLPHCERLLLLRIYGCPGVSLAALRSLAARCPGLRLCAPTSE